MVEIVHPPEPVRPALPIRASRLLELEERRREIFTTKGPDRLTTGCVPLDDHVLRGGFERGIVVGISQMDENSGGDGQLVKLSLARP
jgi:hypothetical protein